MVVKSRRRTGQPTKNSRGDPMPRKIRPMLATLVDAPFDRQGWLFEVKWDGFRAIAEVDRQGVNLYSRAQQPFVQRFAPIVASLRELRHDAVLDGEVVVVDREGRAQFQLLQNYQRTGAGRLLYYVFDLLYLDGDDLRALPLLERKKRLARILKGLPDVRLSEHVADKGVAFYKAAMAQGLEGVMAKVAASPYREGIRSREWLKIKSRRRQEAVVGGFTAPRGSRTHLGALILGVYEEGELVYVGHTGSGIDTQTRADLHARLEPLVQAACPFKVRPKPNAPVQWVQPKLVCEVWFQEWTQDGSMRIPIFIGMRDDKKASQVHRELPKPLDATPAAARGRR